MKKLLALFASTLCITIAAHPAAAVTNGPVNMTVSSSSYNIYYTTVPYQAILDNYPGSVSNSAKGATTGLVGIESAAPFFQQPWWGDQIAAENAALAWYNSSVWTTSPTGANDAVKLPNSSTKTPYFVFGFANASDPKYVYVDSTGALSSPEFSDPGDTNSYALAGVSN